MKKGKLRSSQFRKWMFFSIDVLLPTIFCLFFYSQYFYRFFDGTVSLWRLFAAIVLQIATYAVVYHFSKTGDVIWRFAKARQYFRFVAASLFAGFMSTLYVFFIIDMAIVPMGVFYNSTLSAVAYALVASICLKLGFGTYRTMEDRSVIRDTTNRTIIIGAGQTASNILSELLMPDSVFYPVGFVDDDTYKEGCEMLEIPVLGTTTDIPRLVEEHNVKTLIFAIPSCASDDKKRILNICTQTGCQLRILPSMSRLIENVKLINQVQAVRIEDVLGRDEVLLNNKEVFKNTEGKVCLVTGGGGSIGSELCRQIARSKPKQLLVVDSYENGAYDIQQELLQAYGDSLDLIVEIFSVADRDKMDSFYEHYKPAIVYHAAAHKHVPLMETNPEEAVKNNIVGTLNAAELAAKHGVEKFVLISTDKAVNPTNVMGTTKKICELIMAMMSGRKTGTSFVAVRFGNVLGSNGSSILLFKKQIEHGGPVTVTHPDIIRYFMTISEAVSLVLRAGALAKGGEIFVLDMGEPVKILTLVENLIKLSGLKPYDDVDIKFIGLRPGEKLYEELLIAEEGLEKTEDRKIFVTNQIELDEKEFTDQLSKLFAFANANDVPSVLNSLKEIVPSFDHKVNEKKESRTIANEAAKTLPDYVKRHNDTGEKK